MSRRPGRSSRTVSRAVANRLAHRGSRRHWLTRASRVSGSTSRGSVTPKGNFALRRSPPTPPTSSPHTNTWWSTSGHRASWWGTRWAPVRRSRRRGPCPRCRRWPWRGRRSGRGMRSRITPVTSVNRTRQAPGTSSSPVDGSRWGRSFSRRSSPTTRPRRCVALSGHCSYCRLRTTPLFRSATPWTCSGPLGRRTPLSLPDHPAHPTRRLPSSGSTAPTPPHRARVRPARRGHHRGVGLAVSPPEAQSRVISL